MRIALVILAALVVFPGCDNEVNFAAPWKDIPIVHGILAPFDTAHYIRVEKAFLDPERSALEVARIPDSLYYKSLDVSLVNTQNELRFPLVEVEANLEGYVREDGVFATEPNILYKVRASDINLRAGTDYRLEIIRDDVLPIVIAETRVLGVPRVNTPREGQLLRFTYEREFDVAWQEVDDAFIYDVRFDMHITEVTGTGEQREVVVQWIFDKGLVDTEASTLGIVFYQVLADQLEADPTISRIFRGMDLEVLAGGRELFEFQTIIQANSGITSAGGDIPTYTNLSEGAGILTSANRNLQENFQLHPATADSLRNGSITRDLNFQ